MSARQLMMMVNPTQVQSSRNGTNLAKLWTKLETRTECIAKAYSNWSLNSNCSAKCCTDFKFFRKGLSLSALLQGTLAVA
jgi:regulator of sigma D